MQPSDINQMPIQKGRKEYEKEHCMDFDRYHDAGASDRLRQQIREIRHGVRQEERKAHRRHYHYEPMDYKDENGEWTGFDAEFARMFAKELGVDCEFFVIADWGQKFFELDSKNIDAIWNGMTITDEVTLNTNCSNPYVVNAQVVIMKADVVGNYTSTDSLKDLTFAVESGSAGEDAVKDLGITDYVAVQDQTKAVMEVSAGTADACVVDITLANAMTGEGTNYDDLASGISLSSEEYGVGFRKESDLTDAFNKFMEKCLADGSLQALADKYSLTLVG